MIIDYNNDIFLRWFLGRFSKAEVLEYDLIRYIIL